LARSRHNERCPDCKKSVAALLGKLFGTVEQNRNLSIPARLEDYGNSSLLATLEPIYFALQEHRGFRQFIRTRRLAGVDFYLPGRMWIVEFDESQHFTIPRSIALKAYPVGHHSGFDADQWIALCQNLRKADNDPPFRDEQRAWYDTLRDFAPEFLGGGMTLRLHASEQVWCSLDPCTPRDLNLFERILCNN